MGADQPAATSVANGSLSVVQDSAVLTTLSKRLRNARKKLTKIEGIEASVSLGKAINADQEDVLKSKPGVVAVIDELLKLEGLMREAVTSETAAVAERVRADVVAELKAAEPEPVEEPEVPKGVSEEEVARIKLEAEKEAAGVARAEMREHVVSRLMALLHFTCAFRGPLTADLEACLQHMAESEGSLTQPQLAGLCKLGSFFSGVCQEMLCAEGAPTHRQALASLKEMSLAFLNASSDAIPRPPADDGLAQPSYKDVAATLEALMASSFMDCKLKGKEALLMMQQQQQQQQQQQLLAPGPMAAPPPPILLGHRMMVGVVPHMQDAGTSGAAAMPQPGVNVPMAAMPSVPAAHPAMPAAAAAAAQPSLQQGHAHAAPPRLAAQPPLAAAAAAAVPVPTSAAQQPHCLPTPGQAATMAAADPAGLRDAACPVPAQPAAAPAATAEAPLDPVAAAVAGIDKAGMPPRTAQPRSQPPPHQQPPPLPAHQQQQQQQQVMQAHQLQPGMPTFGAAALLAASAVPRSGSDTPAPAAAFRPAPQHAPGDDHAVATSAAAATRPGAAAAPGPEASSGSGPTSTALDSSSTSAMSANLRNLLQGTGLEPVAPRPSASHDDGSHFPISQQLMHSAGGGGGGGDAAGSQRSAADAQPLPSSSGGAVAAAGTSEAAAMPGATAAESMELPMHSLPLAADQLHMSSSSAMAQGAAAASQRKAYGGRPGRGGVAAAPQLGHGHAGGSGGGSGGGRGRNRHRRQGDLREGPGGSRGPAAHMRGVGLDDAAMRGGGGGGSMYRGGAGGGGGPRGAAGGGGRNMMGGDFVFMGPAQAGMYAAGADPSHYPQYPPPFQPASGYVIPSHAMNMYPYH